MEDLIIVGTGVNGRKAYEFIKMYNLYNILGFAVNSEYYSLDTFCGLPVYKLEEIKTKIDKKFKVFVALFWNRLNADRKKLFEYCKKQGLEFANLISPHAVVNDSATLGVNCWIHDLSCILNNTVIEDNVIVMPYALIGADCKIKSHSFIGARSLVGEESLVNKQTFTGFNSTILDGTIIGEKCIVGAGTLIKRNLPRFSRCIVSSDNQIINQYSDTEIESKLLFSKNVR